MLHNIGFDYEIILRDCLGNVKRHEINNNPIEYEGLLKVETFDNKNNKTHEYVQPMRSFVGKMIDSFQGFPAIMFQSMLGTNANSGSGIRVGSGTNAVTLADTGLQTTISHSASGLYYLAGSVKTGAVVDGSNIKVEIQREFRNDSASTTYDISEAGILAYDFLARDVFTPISLTVGNRARITYTFLVPTSTTKTWTKWFAQCFRAQAGTITNGFTDTSNTTRTVAYIFETGVAINAGSTNLNAPANIDTFGILLGSGTTDCSWTDYNLASKITQGTGAGQLIHSICGDSPSRYVAPYTSGSSRIVEYWRDFTNSSGGNITVSEYGVVINGNSNYKFLMLRGLLGSPIVCGNGEMITFKFKPKVTV